MVRRRLKRVLMVATAVVVIAVAVMLLPPVQTALVRAAAARAEGVDVELGRVWAGPWGADLRDLRVRIPGIEIEIPRAEADIAFWSSLVHLRLDVEHAAAGGVRLRVGRLPARAAEAAEPVEFDGLAPLARVPGRIVVRRVEADGSVEIALSDTLGISGPWSVSAAEVGPNREPQGTLKAELAAGLDGEVFAAVEVAGSLAATVDGDASISSATLEAGLHSLNGDTRGLDATVELVLAPGVESYRLAVDGSGGRRIVDATADFDPSTRIVDAAWHSDISPELLAVFARGRTVPELSVVSSGSARLDLNTSRFDVEAGGRLEGRGWAEFDPRLREIGELLADFDVAASGAADRLEARRLRVAMTGPGGRELLRLTALQPVAIDLEAWRFTPEAWGEPALRFEADGLPLRWARGFDPALVVDGGSLSLSLDVVPVDARHTALLTSEPVRIAGLQFGSGEGVARPPTVDLTIVPRLELDDGVLEAGIDRAELAAASGFVLRFTGRATTSPELWPVIALEGDLGVREPRLKRLVESLDEIRGGARFDLDLEALTLAIDRADLDVTAIDGRPLVAVRFDNEVPLRVPLPAMAPDWQSVEPQRAEVVFDGLPIAWVSPFIPELDLIGGAIYGELRATGGGRAGLTLEPTAPFEIRDLQPVYRGQTFAGGSTVSLEPHLSLDNTAARFALETIRLRTPNRDRLDGEVVLEAERDGRGRVDASVFLEGEFPSVSDRIGKLGALSWRQKCVLDLPSRSVEVTDLEIGLTDTAGTRFLELSDLRPFSVSVEPFALSVDGGSPDVLVAAITPLQLQQLFPQVLGFHLEGVLPQGQFVGRVENGGLLLVADEPLVFKDVTVRWEEAALLDRVTVGLQYQVFYSAEGLQARSIEFSTLGPRGTPIADATLRAIMPLTDRSTLESLHFEMLANLEPLTRQPVFRGLPDFLEGTIGGSLELSYGDRSTTRGFLRVRGARVENAGSLPDLDAALDVVSVEGERLEITAPLRLTSEDGISDLNFGGVFLKDEDAFRFDATLKSERIVVPDLMRLVNLMAPPDPDANWQDSREPVASAFRERWSKAAVAQLRERRDAKPFWSDRVTGQASLDIGAVELARYAVEGVHGRLVVEPSRIALEGVEASLFGAQFAMGGGLAFDGSAELPYDLQLESTFDNLDLGRLFRAVDPDAPPTLEGIFEVHTSASGHGRNLADLGLGTLGSVRVSGRDGVFRGLAGQFGLARKGAKVVGFLTFSKQLKAIGRLLDELESLEFDSFDLELARETPRRFGISGLTVVSPLARIDGTGGVEVEPGVPLALSPLDMSLTIDTRGDMTILFDGLGLLDGGEDANGYRSLTRPVSVGGTVAEPDTSEFYEMLDDAAANSKGVVGVAMRKANTKLQKAQDTAQQ